MGHQAAAPIFHPLFPESRRFPNETARSIAWQRVWRLGGYRRYGSWRRAMAAILIALAALLSIVAAIRLQLLSIDAMPFVMISGLVALPLFVVAIFWTPMRRALRHELAVAGVPVCIPCGYDLRGHRGGSCPECGAPAPDPESLPPLVVESPSLSKPLRRR